MNTIVSFITVHQTISALVAYFLFSNFASSLPSPSAQSSAFYKWLFAFSASLGAALPRLFPSLRLPSDPTAGQPTYFSKPVEAPKQ